MNAKWNTRNHFAPNLWLSVFALKRPVTTIMVMLALFITGLVASRLIPRESWPSVNVPKIFINIPYQGSTPNEVERLIIRPVEEALATMSNIRLMTSTSSADSAHLILDMTLDSVLTDEILNVRDRIDLIRHLLPKDIEHIYVEKFSTNDIPMMTLTLSGNKNLSKAHDFLEQSIIQPITRLKGVGTVKLRGVVQAVIQIELDANKMAMYRIKQTQLMQDLRSSNFVVKSATIITGQKKIRLLPQGEYQNLADIRNLQIRPGIKLADIATVSMVFPRQNSELRINRKKSVGLDIFQEPNANVVDVTHEITQLIDQLQRQDNFKEIKLRIKSNSGEEIQKSLAQLLTAGTAGIILSFLVLFIFFKNYRITLVVVISIPISISFALSGMYFMGYSLNMLTLAGLFIAVGLLIDNSVVISESIIQQQHKPLSPFQKTISGVDNVSIAVISGTLTTIIIFLPLLMSKKNAITVLLEQIGIAICLPLLASLIVAKTIIPLMLNQLKSNDVSRVLRQNKLTHLYRLGLEKTLLSPKLAGLVILLICGLGGLAQIFVSEQQPHHKKDKTLSIIYNIQGKQKLSDIIAVVDSMENYLYSNQDNFYFKQVDSRIYDGYASSVLKLTDDLPYSLSTLKEKIHHNFPKSAIARPSFEWSTQKQTQVKLSLTGVSTEKLLFLSNVVIPQLAKIKGFDDVSISKNNQQKELLLRINSEKVARLGTNTALIAQHISTALRGANLRSFKDIKGNEIAIRLVYHPNKVMPLAKMKQLPIYEKEGVIITLQQLVTFENHLAMQKITREDQETSLIITINLIDITRKQAANKINKMLSTIAFPANYTWHLGKKYHDDWQIIHSMIINMILAFALIFMVMAALFESLLMPAAILSSIILAIIGVYFTFAILQIGLDETAIIGMLILMGIVVNNGIVLIDQINKLKGSAENLIQPIINACVSRLRPILMTVATTVIGLFPLTLASGDNDTYPMAVAIIGGLIFSTFTSLFIVPYCYFMLIKLGNYSSMRVLQAKIFADKYS